MKDLNKGKQMRNVWEISAPLAEEKKFGKHPTQKPVELLTRIILASTKENDLVLDPFCGSSTTGVGAVSLDRKYVGIDLEDEYLNLSVKRLEEFTKQHSLFMFNNKTNNLPKDVEIYE